MEVVAEENGDETRNWVGFIDRLEILYLKALRVALLLLATLAIVYAIWLAGSGVYKLSRDADAVKQEAVVLPATEVAALPTTSANTTAKGENKDPYAAYYADFLRKYHTLYIKSFQPYEKPDDERLTAKAFDRDFLQTSARLEAIKDGRLSAVDDQASLDRLLKTMQEVAALPDTVKRLERYRAAKRTAVARVVAGSRPERYCSYYSEYLEECMLYGTRSVETKRTVTDMRLPDGVMTPRDLFHAYQNRFFGLLEERDAAAKAKAATERDEILAGNVEGSMVVWQAVQFVGAFLALMLLFLLIAIERHQRDRATRRESTD